MAASERVRVENRMFDESNDLNWKIDITFRMTECSGEDEIVLVEKERQREDKSGGRKKRVKDQAVGRKRLGL